MNKRLVNSLMLIALAACTPATAPERSIQVDVIGEAFRAPATVQFTVRNDGMQSAYVSHCGDRVLHSLERRGNEWVNAGGAICPANLMSTNVELLPGESLTDTAYIAEPGTYRVVVHYGSGELRILYGAASGAFAVQ